MTTIFQSVLLFSYSQRIFPPPRARNLGVANLASYMSYGPIYSADEWYLSLCNPAKFCGGAERWVMAGAAWRTKRRRGKDRVPRSQWAHLLPTLELFNFSFNAPVWISQQRGVLHYLSTMLYSTVMSSFVSNAFAIYVTHNNKQLQIINYFSWSSWEKWLKMKKFWFFIFNQNSN